MYLLHLYILLVHCTARKCELNSYEKERKTALMKVVKCARICVVAKSTQHVFESGSDVSTKPVITILCS
jgi:hypothetical protein